MDWKRLLESMLGAALLVGFIPAVIAAWFASVKGLLWLGAPELVCVGALPFASVFILITAGIYRTNMTRGHH